MVDHVVDRCFATPAILNVVGLSSIKARGPRAAELVAELVGWCWVNEYVFDTTFLYQNF